MNQDQKDQLKVKTNDIRVKLTDNSTTLQGIRDEPTELTNRLNERITLSNDLIHSLDLMDEWIDQQE